MLFVADNIGPRDPGETPSGLTVGATELRVTGEAAAGLRSELPAVADATVAAITREVPTYAGPITAGMGETLQQAVVTALSHFLDLLSRPVGSDPGTPMAPAREGAYTLGSAEARSGRSVDALLTAYRVGARVAWREMSAHTLASGLVTAHTVARFAELLFAYIDALSAASVAGHTDELSRNALVGQRSRERLARAVLQGAPEDVLRGYALRATWDPPRTLTAALLPRHQLRDLLVRTDPRTLTCTEEVPGLDDSDELAAVLLPDAHGPARAATLHSLRELTAVVGPPRPWHQAASSWQRVMRVQRLPGTPRAGTEGTVHTDDLLADLVLAADPEALADLRERALRPLAGLRPHARQRLTETLRAWLLHHGRRQAVADTLFVHPQTVRYRVAQLREHYGDRLEDPLWIRDLTLALATWSAEPR